MSEKLSFKHEIATGHLVQITTIIVSVVSLYFGLIYEIEVNGHEIANNTKEIARHEAVLDRHESRFVLADKVSQRRIAESEARITEQLTQQLQPINKSLDKVNDDLSWLVRREADKKK